MGRSHDPAYPTVEMIVC